MKRISTFLFSASLCLVSNLWAESITYRIVEFNDQIQDFVLAPCGQRPIGSIAYFENKFGATPGNRYNQIPRNNQATLWLEGWDGCKIESVTLSLCSNNKQGSAALQILMDDEVAWKMNQASFDSDEWFGEWISKDHGLYVDVEKSFDSPITVKEDACLGISLKGGTSEGSVYLGAVTIDYTPASGMNTESPLGWIYEKIENKGKVVEGDVVMIYRDGSAAADYDGMETSNYLDATPVLSTSAVDDPAVLLFTLNKTEDGHWTLTDQHKRVLGATNKTKLVWNGGVKTWDISVGYDGAVISSTKSEYGTIQYNAPANSYIRFWNYTSKTDPKSGKKYPLLFRRVKQQEPVLCNELTLPSHRMVAFGTQDTLVLRYKVKPTTATDQRVKWQSSNEEVVSVRFGIVTIKGLGKATVTASSHDGGCQSTCEIEVVEMSDIEQISTETDTPSTYWDLWGRQYTPGTNDNILLIKKAKIQ